MDDGAVDLVCDKRLYSLTGETQADCRWKFMSPLRRVGSAPNCPDVELAASSWPRRIGGAELS